MKKLVSCFAALLFGASLASCSQGTNKEGFDYDSIPDTMEADAYEIAFVTDIGQLKDKSFNQGTWEGLKKFAHENKKSYKYYQPANANSPIISQLGIFNVSIAVPSNACSSIKLTFSRFIVFNRVQLKNVFLPIIFMQVSKCT